MAVKLHKVRGHKVFLGACCILAATPVIKIADVQLLEIFFFFHVIWLALVLLFQGFRVPLNPLWRTIGTGYAIFFITTLCLALASLRFRFYPPLPSEPFLKQPLILSLARVTELALGAFYMLYIASILRNNHSDRTFAVKFYFWTGFATACFAVISIPLNLAVDIEWGVYHPNLRARGLFNEGGPYGLYLITVMVTGLLLRRAGHLSRMQTVCSAAILLPIFFLAQSKAAVLACFLLFLFNIFIVGTLRFKISLIALVAVFVLSVVTFTNFTRDFMAYVRAYEFVQDVGIHLDQSAYGGFSGRLAGAILTPRMIAAHPVTGIGLGNYPLLFNDPNYLQGLPGTSDWELPGIGILSYIAELGIPLFAYLIALLCTPSFMIYARRSAPIILILSVIQPLTHIFGVQLNFYYPWICSGLALSYADWKTSRNRPQG
jgi:hypothetical protein